MLSKEAQKLLAEKPETIFEIYNSYSAFEVKTTFEKYLISGDIGYDEKKLWQEFVQKNTAQESEKPPLGARPRWIVAEKRIEELTAAIERYKKAGNALPTIIWQKELDELLLYIKNRKVDTKPEKEWRITAFKDNESVVHDTSDVYGDEYYEKTKKSGLPWVETNSALKHNWPIYSVLRLSDNTEFKIGDETQHGKITGFYIMSPDVMRAIFDGYTSTAAANIKWIKHKRTPLFKTQDGVDVFEGNEYWTVGDDFIINSWNGKHNFKNSVKTFATEAAAKEYVKEEKPIFSLKESTALFERSKEWERIEHYIKLAEQKLSYGQTTGKTE